MASTIKGTNGEYNSGTQSLVVVWGTLLDVAKLNRSCLSQKSCEMSTTQEGSLKDRLSELLEDLKVTEVRTQEASAMQPFVLCIASFYG